MAEGARCAWENRSGFTLFELMIVLLIMAVLVAIAVPLFNFSGEEAKKRACQSNLRTLDEAARRYYSHGFRKQDGRQNWQSTSRKNPDALPILINHMN